MIKTLENQRLVKKAKKKQKKKKAKKITVFFDGYKFGHFN